MNLTNKHWLAYMISAYTEPESLENLVKALDCEEADFFIHIDRKMDIAPFYQPLRDRTNVTFLPNERRVKVGWGGVFANTDAEEYAPAGF